MSVNIGYTVRSLNILTKVPETKTCKGRLRGATSPPDPHPRAFRSRESGSGGARGGASVSGLPGVAHASFGAVCPQEDFAEGDRPQ